MSIKVHNYIDGAYNDNYDGKCGENYNFKRIPAKKITSSINATKTITAMKVRRKNDSLNCTAKKITSSKCAAKK